MFEVEKSKWIWYPGAIGEQPVTVLFRKEAELENIPEKLLMRITADTRYKLYINGELAEFGPIKGDKNIWFYDEVDFAPLLKPGKNVAAVEVLRFPEADNLGNQSLFRTSVPGLFLESADEAGKVFETNESWKCFWNSGRQMKPENAFDHRLYIMENTCGEEAAEGWKLPDYDDFLWENAKAYSAFDISGSVSPGNMRLRDIPSMKYEERRFRGISAVRKSGSTEEAWNELLLNRKSVVIPPDSEEIVEIDAGEEMTGFLFLSMKGGRNAVIELLYSECYVQPETLPGFIPMVPIVIKKDRTDSKRGHLEGFTDQYKAGGFGKGDFCEVFDTFWFRTFRYIRLKINTGEEALELCGMDYRETGYPLSVKTSVTTSDKNMGKIWEISERTLRRCMQETYMDCPFYEQLQYMMDTRAQALYTYMISADDRLARRSMDDFRRAQRPDGTLVCCYPSTTAHVIPGFSIYYILMVYDHMMYFGDYGLVKDHLPAIDGILRFFENHLDARGLVGKIGSDMMDQSTPYWSFIDWAPQWSWGVPSAGSRGPITMESLLYIMGLQAAAALNEYCGREGTAGEYRTRASLIQQAVRNYCTDEDGLILDGPGVREYSQHTQVFAVLTDTVDIKQGRKNIKETFTQKEKFAQCSVAMALYLFRALEKTGLYGLTDECWEPWRRMIKNNLTTCVEDDFNGRSDCHAWSALALYELPAVILGVQPSKPGCGEITVRPHAGYLDFAEGDVITPKGMVHVGWKRVDGKIETAARTDAEIKLVVEEGIC
ncbi:MAG: hypothetical protein LUG93_08195 [Lachnospiraceae bacterium]|nr:hypothetical protein [Lachnospiraceae bacterium]